MKKKRLVSILLIFLFIFSSMTITSYGLNSPTEKNDYPIIKYIPGETIEVEVDKTLVGDIYFPAYQTFLLFDGKTLPCQYDTMSGKLKITLPRGAYVNSIDLKKGVYKAAILSKSMTSDETKVSNIVAKVLVEEDIVKAYAKNNVFDIDGKSDIVLKFDAGSGPFKISEISQIGFWALAPSTPGYDEFVHGFVIDSKYYTYDLEKGEIYLSKEYFESRINEFGWNFLPYVYFGTITEYIAANGETITNEIYPNTPIFNNNFVNDNSNTWFFKINIPNSNFNVVRASGNNRYETAVDVADSLKESLNINKFDNIIVANGENYADALAGSYLAKVKNAPILVVNQHTEAFVKNYITKNISNNGTVYILGGEGVISKNFANSLSEYKVKRLGGNNRFETNINILKECNVKSEDILICSAWSFADSLSASAVGKPILLVDTNLNSLQIEYLNKLSSDNYYLIGGYSAVSSNVLNQLSTYGDTTRVSGSNRYETAKAVAEQFFPNGSDSIVIASGNDFPDGLTGGPLAMAKSAPLFLINEYNTISAEKYIKDYDCSSLTIVGGAGAVSNEILSKIFTNIFS